MSVEVVTLGCRLNIAESEAIREGLADARDIVVVNSCAVTAEAVVRTRAALRRARRQRPEARIVVTGCASAIDPAAFAGLADAVVPNAAKLDIGLYRHAGLDPASSVTSVEAGGPGPRIKSGVTDVASAPAHARAFVAIQNGCDHACTFCIIPRGRGPNRSLPAGAVVAAVARAVARGAREVVLTGVDLTSWGADLPGLPTLGGLVERILRLVPELPRLRLSSLDPAAVDERLIAAIGREPRVMPHVHLSLQAGADLILKRMRRRHCRADAIGLVRRLKALRPEIAIGADLIAGFPTETAAHFADTLAILEECDIVLPHIFPYSPREGTPAARMPQLEREVIRARAARLRAAGAARTACWLDSQLGTTTAMLVERDGVTGHAEGFAKLRLAAPAPANAILPVRIRGRDGDILLAEAA